MVLFAPGPAAALASAPSPAGLSRAYYYGPPGASGSTAAAVTRDATPGWVPPVRGQPEREFDNPSRPWLPGHRGLDLGAKPGEEVVSPAAGVVHFAGRVVDRDLVTIDVDGVLTTVEPVTPAVKRGDRVDAGQPLGTLQPGGHCTPDGCLHWGIRVGGDYVDPTTFLEDRSASILLPRAEAPEEMPQGGGDGPGGGDRSGGGGAGPWGGHTNGRIPAAALCPLARAAGQLLRCDASRGFAAMNKAYQARFARSISVTDSYRSYEDQVRLKRIKGRIAATPGKSNHGWALALDLGGGINSFGTPTHEWMLANAPKYGFVHPAWARQNGSLPEAWHWEWAGR